MRLAVWKYFPKIWHLTNFLPVCSISWLSNSAVLIALEPQLIQVGSNSMFFPHVDDHICLRRFEAGVETFPHISHENCFCQSFVPFERRVTQCSNVWQNEARNKGFHLKHNQRAWVLVWELTYLHMGSPFVLLSAVEKLMGLQGCGFGKLFVTTSSMSALLRPSLSLSFHVYLQVVSTRKGFST